MAIARGQNPNLDFGGETLGMSKAFSLFIVYGANNILEQSSKPIEEALHWRAVLCLLLSEPLGKWPRP